MQIKMMCCIIMGYVSNFIEYMICYLFLTKLHYFISNNIGFFILLGSTKIGPRADVMTDIHFESGVCKIQKKAFKNRIGV